MENYSEIVQGIISSYSPVGCNMSLKLHALHSHLDFSLKTWKMCPMNVAEGLIRIFPKLKRCIEENADYCWNLVKEKPICEYMRQNNTK